MTQGKLNQHKEDLLDQTENIPIVVLKNLLQHLKSSSSIEKAKLETLYSPNKGIPKIIKSHEDSENSSNKSKLSSKMYFWGSTDLSPGVEKLFNAMNICDNSKSLIISINLCNIKNMIHLSNLELDELSSLFSSKDLRYSSFQDTIIMLLCLGK
jgi:hypothetical protein